MLRVYVERGVREYRKKKDPQILAKDMLFGFAVALVKAAQEASPPDIAGLAAAGHYFLARHAALPSDDSTGFDFAVLIFSVVARQDRGKVPAEVVPHLRPDAPDPFTILERSRSRAPSAGTAATTKAGAGAADRAPAPDEAKAAATRGLSIIREAEKTGDRTAVEHGIREMEASVRLTEGEAFQQARFLNNLAYALGVRYDLSGDRVHLDEAIAAISKSIRLFPPDDRERGVAVNTLGAMLLQRFQRFADPRDLDACVETLREARGSLDPESFCALPNQVNMGAVLIELYERDRHLADLDEAIALLRQAVAQLPAGSPEHASAQLNLGNALFKGYKRRTSSHNDDGDECIALLRAVLTGLGPVDPRRIAAAMNLSSMLRNRFRTGGPADDATEAVRVLEEAMSVLSPGEHWHAILAIQLSQAAAMLDEGPKSFGAGAWGSTSSTGSGLRVRVREAIPSRPPDPGSLISWAYANADAGRAEDSIRELKKRAFSVTESIVEQIEACVAWARIATPVDPAEALAAYQVILARVPDLGGAHLDSVSRLEVFSSFDGMASEAASLAIELGDLEGAVEHLEHGRLLWWSVAGIPDAPVRARPRLRDLRGAAAMGPVIILNPAIRRTDALIVTADDLVVVPLGRPPILELRDRAIEVSAVVNVPELDEVLPEALGWMTREVTAPILDHLRATGVITSARDPAGLRQRAWWCPVGVLSLLPWHAATLDELVSSYAPNLSLLARSHQTRHARRGGPGARTPRVLAVGVSQAPGLGPLPHAAAEATEVATYFPGGPALLLDGAATRARVLAELPHASWLHLACHAMQPYLSPMDGGIALADGEVTMAELMGIKVKAGELAFLNACETSRVTPGLISELITVGMALHHAGYAGVIATSWSIPDRLALDVARSVYHDVTAGGQPDATRAATALRRATLRLRDRYPASPSLWAAFHHIGR